MLLRLESVYKLWPVMNSLPFSSAATDVDMSRVQKSKMLMSLRLLRECLRKEG